MGRTATSLDVAAQRTLSEKAHTLSKQLQIFVPVKIGFETEVAFKSARRIVMDINFYQEPAQPNQESFVSITWVKFIVGNPQWVYLGQLLHIVLQLQQLAYVMSEIMKTLAVKSRALLMISDLAL